MRYHVILQSDGYEWILTELEGIREKIDAEHSIGWQRRGGFYGVSYICQPIREKRGVWRVVEVHNVGHPRSNDSPRFEVGAEIRPLRAVYTMEAWQAMLHRFWPGEGI